MSLETQWLEDVFPIVPFFGDMLVFGAFLQFLLILMTLR